MSVTGSRILSTSASKTFIVRRGIVIAFGGLAGSRRLALCIACEAAVRPALTELLPRRALGRSWRRGENKCGRCDCRRDGYFVNRLHNSLQ